MPKLSILSDAKLRDVDCSEVISTSAIGSPFFSAVVASGISVVSANGKANVARLLPEGGDKGVMDASPDLLDA